MPEVLAPGDWCVKSHEVGGVLYYVGVVRVERLFKSGMSRYFWKAFAEPCLTEEAALTDAIAAQLDGRYDHALRRYGVLK